MDTIFSISGDFATKAHDIISYNGKIIVDGTGEFHGYLDVPQKIRRYVYGIMLQNRQMLACAIMSNLYSGSPCIVACKNVLASSSKLHRGSYWQTLGAYNTDSENAVISALQNINLAEAHNLRIKLRKEKFDSEELRRIDRDFNVFDDKIEANRVLFNNPAVFQNLIWNIASDEMRPQIAQQFRETQIEMTA